MGLVHSNYFPSKCLAYFDALTDPSERKLRLFMIECQRRDAEVFDLPKLLSAVEPFADYLDGRTTSSEMFTEFEKEEHIVYRELLYKIARPTARSAAREILIDSVQCIASAQTRQRHPELKYGTYGTPEWEDYWRVKCQPIPAEDEIRVSWLKDMFGEPDWLVAFPDSWRSESAVSLARTAYDTRDFALLPILADALEEAGCENTDVLTHCRDSKLVHVRGCWVVDAVLNK